MVDNAAGLSAGLRNGEIVRLIPGSSVTRVGTTLVVTMPGDDAGRFSTLVAAAKDAGTVKISAGLRLATGEVVSEVTQTRPVDAAGMATGAVAVSGATLAVVNNSAAHPVAELPMLAPPPPARAGASGAGWSPRPPSPPGAARPAACPR